MAAAGLGRRRAGQCRRTGVRAARRVRALGPGGVAQRPGRGAAPPRACADAAAAGATALRPLAAGPGLCEPACCAPGRGGRRTAGGSAGLAWRVAGGHGQPAATDPRRRATGVAAPRGPLPATRSTLRASTAPGGTAPAVRARARGAVRRGRAGGGLRGACLGLAPACCGGAGRDRDRAVAGLAARPPRAARWGGPGGRPGCAGRRPAARSGRPTGPRRPPGGGAAGADRCRGGGARTGALVRPPRRRSACLRAAPAGLGPGQHRAGAHRAAAPAVGGAARRAGRSAGHGRRHRAVAGGAGRRGGRSGHRRARPACVR